MKRVQQHCLCFRPVTGKTTPAQTQQWGQSSATSGKDTGEMECESPRTPP